MCTGACRAGKQLGRDPGINGTKDDEKANKGAEKEGIVGGGAGENWSGVFDENGA